LKETEYKEVFKEEMEKKAKESPDFVPDCIVETDVEIRFPENYIENIAERMHLYRELDNITGEDELQTFESNLTDRFGPLPEKAAILFDIVKIRIVAKQLGIEKIIFKYHKLYLYFVSNQESYFYNSPQFGMILQWLQNNPAKAVMKEGKDKLLLFIKNIGSIKDIKSLLSEILSFVQDDAGIKIS